MQTNIYNSRQSLCTALCLQSAICAPSSSVVRNKLEFVLFPFCLPQSRSDFRPLRTGWNQHVESQHVKAMPNKARMILRSFQNLCLEDVAILNVGRKQQRTICMPGRLPFLVGVGGCIFGRFPFVVRACPSCIPRQNASPATFTSSSRIDSRPFNFTKTSFDHSQRDRVDTEALPPQHPANAPSLLVWCARYLLVGPQDALRPNQVFHFLQFCPARVNKACILANGLLCWVATLLHSSIQSPSIRSPTFFPDFDSESIWPQADVLQNETHALIWQTWDGACLEHEDIQILGLDLQRTS